MNSISYFDKSLRSFKSLFLVLNQIKIIYNIMSQYLSRLYTLFISLIVLVANHEVRQVGSCQPFGLRLNLGLKFYDPKESEMIGIRFNTHKQCPQSFATFIKKSGSLNRLICNTTALRWSIYETFVHKCSISNLGFGEKYSYMVYGWQGNAQEQPSPYEKNMIKTQVLSNNEQIKLIVLADWGYLIDKAGLYDPLDRAFEYLMNSEENIHGIYVGGDIAYDLDSFQGRYYEDFINMLSIPASRWPLILNIGNHEHLTLESQLILKVTFQVYNADEKRLTVLHLPYANWFMIDPYRIVFKGEDSQELVNKFKQKLQYLKQTEPEKPIVACSHYPYRCNGNIPDCYDVRQKLNPFFKMMMQYNVALYIGAHYHTYQRVYPFFQNQTFAKLESPYLWTSGGKQNFLDNSLLSIVQGIAGNDRQIIMTYPPAQQFTAAHFIGTTGFGKMILQQDMLSYDHVSSTSPNVSRDHWEIKFMKSIIKNNKNQKENFIRTYLRVLSQ